MVRSVVISLFILAVAGTPAAAAEAGKKEPAAKKKPATAETRKLATEKERISYSAGYDMGLKIKDSGVEVDADLVAQGVKDVLKGGTTLMTHQEVGDTIMAYRIAKRNELAEQNRKEGTAFLEENRKKEGVVVLPSGLQYKVLKDGSGKSPKTTDTVTVHYRGTLTNGDEFDSSFKRNQPATFPLDQVIKGWTEGLQLMKEGARWQFAVPSELAYGERGMPGSPIGPHAVLIFEVELISVAPAPAAPEAAGEKK